jgi:hypothetical protein
MVLALADIIIIISISKARLTHFYKIFFSNEQANVPADANTTVILPCFYY